MTLSNPYQNTQYVLPCSEESLSEDRFSVLDSDDALVPTWALITALISEPVETSSALIDKLETIALCISKATVPEYGLLGQTLDERPDFFPTVWPLLAKLALDMPNQFPQGHFPILSGFHCNHIFTRTQTACLVIHQFLCTLKSPPWQSGFQSFHIWYSIDQPHPRAAKAYLTALFTYFERLARVGGHNSRDLARPFDSPINGLDEWPIRYEIHHATKAFPAGQPLTKLNVLRLHEASTGPEVLGCGREAAVISANKFVGFGRTGTQEETHVGASPEACPAVLFTPPLEDDQVLVVTGAEAMITITGYGRNAHCSQILDLLPHSPSSRSRWSARTMLFMDALELDLASSISLPDLAPGNVLREMTKSYTAFSSRPQQPYAKVFTGFWGCKTFGGNPYIKTIIQWVAASFAGVPVDFICSGSDQAMFADDLENFVASLFDMSVNADQLKQYLLDVDPNIGKGNEIFNEITNKAKHCKILLD